MDYPITNPSACNKNLLRFGDNAGARIFLDTGFFMSALKKTP
jgi:hypothetical protein